MSGSHPSTPTHPSIYPSIYSAFHLSFHPGTAIHPSNYSSIHRPQKITPTRNASRRFNILRPRMQADASTHSDPARKRTRNTDQECKRTPQANLKHGGVYVTGLSALMQRSQLRKNRFQHWGWALSFPASCFLWPRRLTKEIKHTSRTKVNFTNGFSRSPPNFNAACDANCDHHRLHPQRH